METEELRKELLKMVETADDRLLKKVLALAKSYEEEKGTDWWDTISDEERKAIEKGLAEADSGQLIPHDEVMKKVRARFKKSE